MDGCSKNRLFCGLFVAAILINWDRPHSNSIKYGQSKSARPQAKSTPTITNLRLVVCAFFDAMDKSSIDFDNFETSSFMTSRGRV